MSSCFDTSDYSLQLAQKYVNAYSEKDVMAQHRDAMKCFDCQDFLQSGIEALKWLKRAEDVIQQAAREGISVPDDVPKAIDVLYRTWLAPCDRAEQLIKQQKSLGYEPSNLMQFMKACEQVKNRIQAIDMYDSIDDAFDGKLFTSSFWADAIETTSR